MNKKLLIIFFSLCIIAMIVVVVHDTYKGKQYVENLNIEEKK